MVEGRSFLEVDDDTFLLEKKRATFLEQALIWTHKAKNGSTSWVDDCTQDQYKAYCYAKRTNIFGEVAKYGLLLCSLFDMPSWCRGTPELCADYVRSMYSPGFPILPHRLGAAICVLLWGLIAWRMHLRRIAQGDAYCLQKWTIFTGVVVFLGLLSSAISIICPMLYDISVLCRPFGFIGATKTIRKGFTDILVSVPGFIDVLLSLALWVFVTAVIGMVIFSRTLEGKEYFPDQGLAVAQMWILFTTNNTPNVMMPGINSNRGYFIFFFVYLIVAVFLLGNLLLARVYNTYKDVLKADYTKFHANRKDSMKRGFNLLCDPSDDEISPDTWKKFFVLCCKSDFGPIQASNPDDVQYNMDHANHILEKKYGVKPEAYENGMDYHSFKAVMTNFFDRSIYIARQRTSTTDNRFGVTRAMSEMMLHGYRICGITIHWDAAVDVLIAIATVLIFIETVIISHTYNVEGRLLILRDQAIFWVLVFFSLIYAVALTTKISTLGLVRFWYRHPLMHRTDLVSVYGLLIAEILYIFFFPTIGMGRLIMVLHICRGLRLFKYIDELQSLATLMSRLVPVYLQMFMTLFLVFWTFCNVGQLWFGGLIYSSNPALKGTQFASHGYDFFELNFNCFASGMMTLFTLMCMNNWSVISAGYFAATQSYLSQAFFVSFTIISNMIVFNILIALVLDATGVYHDELKAPPQDEGEDESEVAEREEAGLIKTQASFKRRLFGSEEDEAEEEESESSDSESSSSQEASSATGDDMVASRTITLRKNKRASGAIGAGESSSSQLPTSPRPTDEERKKKGDKILRFQSEPQVGKIRRRSFS